jgi:hypothetical protein
MIAAVLLAAACGDDGGGAAECQPGGSGTVSGSVMGETIDPVMWAGVIGLGGGTIINLDEDPGASCSEPGQTGQHLVLGFCAPPAPGTYPIVAPAAWMCPTENAFALIEHMGGSDFADGTGGTITIDAVSDDCVTGSYTAEFAGETLSGSFAAAVCM